MGDRSTATPARLHDVRVLVHLEVAEAQHRRGRLTVRPPQDRPDPGHDLLEAERLRDVVVAAEREPSHLLLGAVAGREEQDRHPHAVGTEAPAHLEAVEVGEHHVEHDEVGLVVGDGSERLPAVRGQDDVEPEVTEGGVEQEADVVLVVGDEDARRRGRREAHRHQHGGDF